MEKSMTDFDDVLSVIESYTGMAITNAHRDFMRKEIQERLQILSLNTDEYLKLLKTDSDELTLMTNKTTVNETYFFREEKQFEYLINEYFPKHPAEKISIWSAACSTGEEPLSIYAAAKDFYPKVSVYATDIDTSALQKLKDGKYTNNSFRSDGSKFWPLIKRYAAPRNYSEDTFFTVKPEVIQDINISQFNLISDTVFPMKENSLDIIFLRNVFIYFTPESRTQILQRLAKALKEDGLLFLSINEISGIETKNSLPFKKEHTCRVYFLRKSSCPKEEPQHAKTSRTEQKNTKASISAAQKQKYLALSKNKASVPLTNTSVSQTVQSPEDSRPLNRQTETVSTDYTELDLKTLYNEVQENVDKKHFDQAKTIIGSRRFRAHEMEYKYYLTALVHLGENKQQTACQDLNNAVILNKYFWPALYALAWTQRDLNNKKESRTAFSLCATALKQYIQNGSSCYNFITQEFSPEYFLMMCNNYAKDNEES